MKTILALLTLSLCLTAQTAINPTYTPPTYIVGGGATFFTPGVNGSVDVDVHVSGMFYAHTEIGNIKVVGGQLFATFRPGAEARVYVTPSGLAGLTLQGDGGIALGTNTTLSSFTGGGYAWVDLCQTIGKLKPYGHCYVEFGGAINGGTVVSSTSLGANAIILVPSVKFRWGSAN